MAEIYPAADGGCVEGHHYVRGYVMEGFRNLGDCQYSGCRKPEELNATYGEEEITNIMCDINSNAHIRKVKAIAEGNKSQCDNVMRNKLHEVLAPLLHPQQHNNRLLRPIRRFEQVVRLELRRMGPVREELVHAARVEVPHRRLAHDIQPHGTQYSEVYRGVHLLHEAGLFSPRLDVRGGEGAKDFLHDEFAREG